MIGWIKLPRWIADKGFYLGEKFDRTHCLLDLLLLAEWKENRSFYVRGIEVELTRGQLAVPIRELAKRWSLSLDTVQSRLKDFERKGLISIKRSGLINIITIDDSLLCESPDNETKKEVSSTQTSTENSIQTITASSTESNTQSSTLSLRNNNNIKKEKNTNNACACDDGDASDNFLKAFFAEERKSSIEQLCMSWHTTPEELETTARECVVEWQVTGSDFSEDFQTLSRRLLQHTRAKMKYNREESSRYLNGNGGRSFGNGNRNQIPGTPEGTVKVVEVDGQKVYLGHDEFIHPDGFRTYCRSGEHVPLAAPPRPGKGWWWQPITNSWCDLP